MDRVIVDSKLILRTLCAKQTHTSASQGTMHTQIHTLVHNHRNFITASPSTYNIFVKSKKTRESKRNQHGKHMELRTGSIPNSGSNLEWNPGAVK